MTHPDHTARLSTPRTQRRSGAARRRPRWRLVALELLVVAVVVAVVVIITVGSNSPRTPSQGTQRPFAADSVWNATLPDNVALAPQSAAYVQNLAHQAQTAEPWINTYSYSVPVYTVGASQAKVPVKLDQSGSGSVDQLAHAFAAGVPIPSDARPAKGTDEHMVVWQPSSNTLWEFWVMHKVDGSWHAKWGGKMTDVSGSPGYYTHPSDWGGSATSLSLLGGLMRVNELKSGHIDHALAMAIPSAAAGKFVYPAQRDDGNSKEPNAIPEGTRFRLNPKLNIKALHLPPMTQMIAEAAQRYGIIVRDQAGAVAFYAEPTTSGTVNPYTSAHGLFGGAAPNALLKDFPWTQLQAVSPSWRPGQ
jgi:hypothetical protein